MSEEDSKGKKLKSANIHEGRLRKLIQNLREKEAVIRIDYDPNGNPKTTKYSAKKEIKFSLKDLFINFWTEATDSAYYEYLKTDFTTHRKTPVKSKHHPSYEKFIKDIRCTFKENAQIDQRLNKEQLFFSGARRQQTNVLAAFPNFRRNIITEVKEFVSLLESQNERFPYRKLRNHTSHRCHRFKQLEKDIFQNFKDMDSSRLQKVSKGFTKVMSAFVKRLKALEEEGVGYEQPDGERILENRLRFQELSDPENIGLSQEEEK